MARNRTNVAILAAAATAAVLWLLVGLAGEANVRTTPWAFYVPAVPGGTTWQSPALAGDTLLTLVLVVAVVVGLSVPVLRSTRTGGVALVLALWWVTVVAGGLGTLAWAVLDTDPSAGASTSANALGPGAWWGLLTGWLVGLVAWRVRGRAVPAAAAQRLPRAAAVAGAGATAVLAAIGWASSGLLRSWALERVLPVTSPARQDALELVDVFLPLSRGMSVPVSDTDTAAYLLGAAALAVVVALVGTAAGLAASLRRGRTALVFAFAFATVLGSTAAAFVSVLPLAGQVGGLRNLLDYAAVVVTSGGVWGLMYGWFAALGGLLAAWLVDRSTVREGPTLLTEVPTPARGPDAAPGAAAPGPTR